MEPAERTSDSGDRVSHDQSHRRVAHDLRELEAAGRQPGYGVVLIAIVLTIVMLTAGYASPLGRFLALVMLAAALLLALRAARAPRLMQRRGAVLVGLAVAGGIVSTFTDSGLGAFDQLVDFVLIAVTPVVLARRLVRKPDVTRDSIIGAVCVYLLIALFFAFVFQLTTGFTGTPFFASTTNASMPEYVYFSLVTLTTVGYGDFVARSNLGRMLSVTEALTGQLYLVTVVALLVSNLRRATPNREK